ncbi:hypothetical protein NL676_012246 [Syzygium grande]|nr:hypothetical protein NL676_012246 [Syzygium grande]
MNRLQWNHHQLMKNSELGERSGAWSMSDECAESERFSEFGSGDGQLVVADSSWKREERIFTEAEAAISRGQ